VWVRQLLSTRNALYAGTNSLCSVPGFSAFCDGSFSFTSSNKGFGKPGFYFTVTARKAYGQDTGKQSECIHRTGGISVHTTYLTGLITGLIASEIDKLAFRPDSPESQARDPKTILLCGIWIAFVLGAAMGAAMVFRFSELGILGVALILFAIMVSKSTHSALAYNAT
jgi:hypothetical protein